MLESASVDAIFIADKSNAFYYSGYYNPDCFVLILQNEAYYITDSRYEVEAKSSLPACWQLVICGLQEQLRFVQDKLRVCSRIGYESDIPLSLFREIEQDTMTAVSEHIAIHRMRKTPVEIAKIAYAESIVDNTFATLMKSEIREGVTERQLANRIRYIMEEFGAEGLAFDSIVAFGENSAKPHARPSNRQLKRGDNIVIDIGAKYQGYCSDFTRTVSFGEPTSEYVSAYEAVLGANLVAIDRINAGISAAQADTISRDYIAKCGYGAYFNHSLGHGVGIDIHEPPYLRADNGLTLQDGMVFTVEPGIYLEGKFGIRIEDLCYMENGCVTVIDRSDKKLISI